MKSGNLSIHTENIFPIIKKFLYSNQEVFLRELVSNAVDATQKIKTLASMGEFQGELGETKIEISIDPEAKTLKILDRGIGMTADEVEKYINQIAFSSAGEFLDKYKDSAANIIGHFGLGFYSAFMVAGKVELITKSYQDAPAVKWICDGSTSYEILDDEKQERGTEIILHIEDEHEEYLKSYRIEEILNKYCRFLPVPVEFEEKIINDVEPIWTKHPTSLTDTDYSDFYRNLYPMSEPPLFWIHLNVDYPFNLTGVLYFPKVRNELDLQKNKIQLYSNQVFITDSVEDIVPEYLTLLHGVIDSPDIPLNVSRSYLQTDAAVRKISSYISKKVAEKLNNLFKENREDFENKWEFVGTFVKYGMIKDSSFYDQARKFCLVHNTDGKCFGIDEYLDFIRPNQTDKNDKLHILYSDDKEAQHAYIASAKRRDYDVLLLDNIIDPHFIGYMEHQLGNTDIARVDSDTIDKLIDKGIEKSSLLSEEEEKEIRTIFQNVVNKPLVRVELQANGEDDLPVTVTKPEHQRRIMEMQKRGMMGMGGLPDMYNLVINTGHPLSKKLLSTTDSELRSEMAQHAFELALLSQNMLAGSEMTAFIERNIKLMKDMK